MAFLTPGKMRGLRNTSDGGVFNILALDHRQSFAKMLQPDNPDYVSYAQIVEVKSAFVRSLAPTVSAVLLDPVYGAAQTIANGALPGGKGLLVAVEESGYTGEATARHSALLPGWSIAKSKRMGADAIKLLVYYHPDAGELSEQQEALIADVNEQCRQADLAIFLEILTYSIDSALARSSAEFARLLPGLMERIARRMGALKPDVLKLEFPANSTHDRDPATWTSACEAVSTAACVPWTVLSAGADYELFCRQVETACKAGASGFIGGRSVWQEGVSMPAVQRDQWLHKVATPRMKTLSEIARRHAQPWTNFYPPPPPGELEDWYQRYE
ncbi:MAG TPA: tagatose 1,6-diphosphate aldolase [Levilinea sp.]|nr:tagatose 1,6-diphosphate aldolase [Levilinea sp.]